MANHVRSLGTVAALLGTAALMGCSGDDGAQGPPGPAGDAGDSTSSLSAVVPNSAFLARTLDVSISGYGTQWADGVVVDFGADITVNEITVASPTALVANVTVAATAEAGLRDISVSAGAAPPLTYLGAFHVDPPYELLVQGAPAQGSIFLAQAHGRDLATPFDTTSEGDGFFTPISFPNVAVTPTAGLDAQINSVELYTVDMLVTMDIDAAGGARDFDIVSGPEGAQTEFPNPGVLAVAERTATDIDLGTTATGTVSAPYESFLYRVTVPAGARKMLSLRAGAMSTDGPARLAVLPESGRFEQLLGFTSASYSLTPAAGLTLYVVYWDGTGVSGYDFNIRAEAPDVTIGAESEPNEFATPEQATALPFVLEPAALATVSDEDWIEFTVAAGDVGKQVRVITMAGDDACDNVVEVFESDGTTTFGGPSSNAGYHENHVTAPIATAGTYYVKVTADQSGWYNPSYPNYAVYVGLE